MGLEHISEVSTNIEIFRYRWVIAYKTAHESSLYMCILLIVSKPIACQENYDETIGMYCRLSILTKVKRAQNWIRLSDKYVSKPYPYSSPISHINKVKWIELFDFYWVFGGWTVDQSAQLSNHTDHVACA